MIRLVLIAVMASALAGWAPRTAGAQSQPVSPADAREATVGSGRLHGGLVLGANFSDMGGSEEVEVTIGAARFDAGTELAASDNIAAGGFVSYALGPCWSLRAEALLSVRGAEASGELLIEGADQAIPFAVRHTLRYIQVPILIQRSLHYDGHIVPRLYAGPSVAVMLTSRADGETVVVDADDNIMTVSAGSDIEEVSGRVDVGAMIGAGVTFPAWRGRVLIEARYEMFVTRAVNGRFTLPIGEFFGSGIEVAMNARSLRNRGLSLFIGFEL